MKDFKSFLKKKFTPRDRELGSAILSKTRIEMTPGQSLKEEEDIKAIIAAQNTRKANEASLETRLSNHFKSGNHMSVLKDYTNNSSDVNNHLWNAYKGNAKQIHPSIEAKIHKMDVATTSQKTPEAFTVYSSSIHHPKDHMNSEGIMHHPAYLSTSIRKSVPEGHYSGRNMRKNADGKNVTNIYKIDVPKNHPGMYIADKHTIDANAKEFVLPRGTNLKHISTKTSESDSIIQHEHHVKVIPHD